MPTTKRAGKKTSKRAASAAGAVMGLTEREFMEAFEKWWPKSTDATAEIADFMEITAKWAYRHLARRAKTAAASALAQREGKR